MKISYNWLREYVGTSMSPSEAEKVLSSIGLEVEAMESVEEIPGSLDGVVVGEVVECGKHPDADKLSLTKVDAGEAELLQIVCGAPNVAKGQKVLVAKVGTTLTFTSGEQVKLKRAKIRGVESAGMICAEDELGIGTSHDGIMVLPVEAVVGTPAKEYLGLETDTLMEIGLTPNRVDAASHIGVARDLSAWLRFNGTDARLVKPSVEKFDSLKRGSEIASVKVNVVATDGAPRYAGLTFDNITLAPSPDWLKKRLTAIGLRPINNIVDITNFILHETGHPLHAFDYDKIAGKEVVVRRAKEGELFTTLDGVERKLTSEDLMICDAEKPMTLAGIFGGAESGITSSTKRVFLESAYFNPVSIRKSSKRHQIKTDASFRYERGADPEMVPYALKRAAILFQELAGATVVGEIADLYPEKIERAVVEIIFDRVEGLIGKKIGRESILNILAFLEYDVVKSDETGATISVPCYRVDVTRECDIVEDVLRIYGYNNVEIPERMVASITPGRKPDPENVKEGLSAFLSANGFHEIMNNSLTKGEYYSKLKTFPQENLVHILNPLSTDLNVMRQTLILNGLEVISYNINRQMPDLKIFEVGNVYSLQPSGEGDGENSSNLKSYKESAKISIFVSGPGTQSWRAGANQASYFLLKGYLELMLKRYGVEPADLEFSIAPADIFSEGLVYKTQSGKEIAVMGSVSQSLLKRFGIKQQVFAAEISWDVLFQLVKKQKVLFKEMPKFPEVRRDLALLLDESVNFSDLRKSAFKAERKILKSVTLFDVYRGEKIPEGKKQYAISFVLQDAEKTLTDKYVEETMSKLLKSFESNFGAQLR
ncbi:MAG: phenylalanine--tRNA ligase subunit beta [Bacteroidales bacterium]|jgi:phenylalanyl-tRNA synthetase beta chain|nr:phenylalanine--tRNA ligase subunit beta [Bacteroidales bacterium]